MLLTRAGAGSRHSGGRDRGRGGDGRAAASVGWVAFRGAVRERLGELDKRSNVTQHERLPGQAKITNQERVATRVEERGAMLVLAVECDVPGVVGIVRLRVPERMRLT